MDSTLNPLSIAIQPLNRLVSNPYYDLETTIKVMHRLYSAAVVDGFEFQNLAEYDGRLPPRDEAEFRLKAWQKSQKYNITELGEALQKSGVPIISVHANRDVGIYLCSGNREEIAFGCELIRESLWLAEQVSANTCVFHLWDTRKEDFNPTKLEAILNEITVQYPKVRAAVENVPTHLSGKTPFDLLGTYRWITMDLRWAGLYDELHKYKARGACIANVHLSGQLSGDQWIMNPEWFGSHLLTFSLEQAVRQICGWGYRGIYTVEPRLQPGNTWESLVEALHWVRGVINAEKGGI